MEKNNIPDHAYQAIELADGKKVEGNDRSYLNEIIFDDQDMSGKDLLDIGSSQGYFCLQALARGARSAVGIDPLPGNVEMAKSIAAKQNLSAEYIETDFESWDTERKFDTVLCLNVLHHMYHPISVLHKMIIMTREKLIIEFSPPRWKDVWAGRIGLMSFLARGDALIAIGKPPHQKDSVRAAEYTFMFTPEALRTFFDTYYACFGPLTIKKSPFKGRMIAIAEKRKIGTLTIVAGPTSAGKSTFIEKLKSSPELCEKLDIPAKIDALASYRLYREPLGEKLEHVVMHYDMLRPFMRAIRTYDRDPVLSIVSAAEHINVVTLQVDPGRLLDQINEGEPADSPRHNEIRAKYKNPDFLKYWYGMWKKFFSQFSNVRHIDVKNDGEFKVVEK